MGDTSLSQEEINALFNAASEGGGVASTEEAQELLSNDEIDTIGEISNISMGSAATALFSLVNKKVEISTPIVKVASWEEIIDVYERPCVLIKISYTKGLDGSNLLILKERDVKIITNLMMGGDGTELDEELGEIHLSAISEAMNQMMGSAATSLSSMLNKMVDISPPSSDLIDLHDTPEEEVDPFLTGRFIKIEFRLQVGDLVDSIIMQLYPVSLAKEMCQSIMNNMTADSDTVVENAPAAEPEAPGAPATAPQPMPDMTQQAQGMPQGMPQMDPNMMANMGMGMGMPMMGGPMMAPQQPVNVQPAQFTPFAGSYPMQYSPENIDLIMDVPLEVTVELGRTHKSISDILDFSPGTIIELNKIAGEPIDVLVNGKYVAKGEVVVIEESFGIRITEIMK